MVDSVFDLVPLLVLGLFTVMFVQMARQEVADRGTPWATAEADVLDVVQGRSAEVEAYHLLVRLYLPEGTTVEARAREPLSHLRVDGLVGTRRRVWYRPDAPHVVRLEPPSGAGWFAGSGLRLLIMGVALLALVGLTVLLLR